MPETDSGMTKLSKFTKILQQHHLSVSKALIEEILSPIKTIPFETTLFDLLCEKENQNILQSVKELPITFIKNSQKQKKILLSEILKQIIKPKRYCQIDDCTFEQTYYKGVEIGTFEKEKAWPSLSDDVQDLESREHVSNLGVVSFQNDIVVIRSGKSDTPERLCELMNFISRIQTSRKSSHVIFSFKDLSLLKRFTTLKSSDNERKSILCLAKAIDAWPKKEPLIFLNLLFSGTAKGLLGFDLGRSASRFLSFLGNQKLLSLWFQKNPNFLNDALKEWFCKIENAKIMDFFSTRSFFDSHEYKAIMHEQKRILSTIKSADAIAFQSVLFSHETMHVADVFLYYLVIFKSLGLSFSVQCKSGLDRTGLAVALSCAAFTFEKECKKPFLPHEHENPSYELSSFKSYFRKALFSLCLPVTTESRGEYGLLWGKGPHGNPVPRKYLFLKEDLPFMKESDSVDIENLTYDDLRSKGRRQYKGNFINPKIFYGKTLKPDW